MNELYNNNLQKIIQYYNNEGYFGSPNLPWLTARFIINFIDSGIDSQDHRIQKAVKWLEIEQSEEGNWHSSDAPFNPDVEVTTMCIVALRKGGIRIEELSIRKGLHYLERQRLPDGSWDRDSHFTAHVLEALHYCEQEESDLFKRGLQFLKNSIQNWSTTWQPHSVGEIFFILTEIITFDNVFSTPINLTLSEINSFLEEIKEVKDIIKRYNEMLHGSEEGYLLQKQFCLLTGSQCNREIRITYKDIFIGFQFDSEYYDTQLFKNAIFEAVNRFNFNPFFPDEYAKKEHITCKICEKIQCVKSCIFDLSDLNPNVLLELGLAYGFGKNIFIIRNIVIAQYPVVSNFISPQNSEGFI